MLALAGDGGYPYSVPITYIYTDDGRFLFHCAKTGHKLDAIRREPKASICVVDDDNVKPEEFTTYFRSVIAFGKIRILEDPEEMYAAIDAIGAHFWPGHDKERAEEIHGEMPALCLLEMTVDHMTGKEAIEYVRAREAGDL